MLLPYYIQVFTNPETADTTSDIADIALNLPGIVNAMLHILLVNNYDRMAIQSRRDTPKKMGEVQLLRSTEYDLEAVTPVSPKLGPSGLSDLALIGADNGRTASRPNTLGTRHTNSQVRLPRSSSFAELPKSPQREMRNQSRYSIFPTRASQRPVSWSTIPTRSDHESVQLPPPLFASRFQRNNSDGSTATVQIGLRLSDTGQEESSLPDPLLIPRQEMWDAPSVLRRGILSMSDASDYGAEPTPATPKLHTSRSYRSINRDSLASLSGEWEEQRQQMMTKSLPPIPPPPSPGIPPMSQLNQAPPPSFPPLPSPGLPPTPRLNQPPLPPLPPLPRAEISNNPRFTVMSAGLPASPRPLTMMSVGLPPTPRLSIPRLPTPRMNDAPPMPTQAGNWSPMVRDTWR